MGKSFGKTYADAAAFLLKGKDKFDRPLSANTRLRRTSETSISVVLHNTAVVTLHADDTFTIYGGGWNTVTTKKTIREYGPVSVHSVDGKWVVGYTTEKTPARVQKCRTCKGRGKWQEMDYCQGPCQWNDDYCMGGSTAYRKDVGEEGWWESRYSVPCPHGQQERHAVKPCRHGEMTRHALGYSERTCYRCSGEGRLDYGSKPIPITVTAEQAYKVDSSGTFLGLTDRPSIYASGHTPSKPSKVTPIAHSKGGEIVDELAALLPGVKTDVRHPVSGALGKLSDTIVSLNDGHGWSRERIADWLETLDVDLRFPSAG